MVFYAVENISGFFVQLSMISIVNLSIYFRKGDHLELCINDARVMLQLRGIFTDGELRTDVSNHSLLRGFSLGHHRRRTPKLRSPTICP
jgi:hypothetical protein